MRKFVFILIIIAISNVSCSDLQESFLGDKGTMPVLMRGKRFVEDTCSYRITRSSLIPTSNGTEFKWKKGDIVGVYSSIKGLTNFFIDEESLSKDSTQALFNGSGFSLKPNSYYYAFYPYNPSALDKKVIPVSYALQHMNHNGAFADLGNFDYMVSKGETNNQSKVEFEFKHIGCVVECKIKIPTSATYTKVKFETNNNQLQLIKSGSVDITSPEVKISNDTEMVDSFQTVVLNSGNGIKIEKDSILTVYMMMAPQDLSGNKLNIRLIDENSNWYLASVEGKNMKAGYTYHYSIGDNSNDGNFTGTGSGLPNDFDYEIISSYENSKNEKYEQAILDGTFIYTIGGGGIEKLDCSDEKRLVINSQNSLTTTNKMLSRSFTKKGDIIYVCKRCPLGGMKEVCSPSISLYFDSNIEQFEADNNSGPISNNQKFNSFFEEIKLKSVNPSKIKTVYIFKCYLENGRYRNCIRFQDEDKVYYTIFNKYYPSEIDAINDLKDSYTSESGDKCKVNWSVVERGRTSLTNLKLYIHSLGVFDGYIQNGNTYVNETGPGGPNLGKYSAKIKTTQKSSYAYLYKNIEKEMSTGECSLWINFSTFTDGQIKVPILGNNTNPVLSFFAVKDGNAKVRLYINEDRSSYVSLFTKEWYNIKIKVTNSKLIASYRSKESGMWKQFASISLNSIIKFNELCIGAISDSSDAEIMIDDMYFDENLDKVSYINGEIDIVNSTDLSLLGRYYLDLKPTGSIIKDNILIVCFLKGFNIYDISTPDTPVLLSYYRSPDWKEYQGIDVFEANGKVYAFICNYSLGFSIVDVTNPQYPEIVSMDSHEDLYINETSLYKKGFTFDIVVDYPFAYSTYCTGSNYLNTEYDYKGVIKYDLRDLKNIKKTVCQIPKNDCFESYIENRITKNDKYIYLSVAEKGIAVFGIDEEGTPYYIKTIQFNDTQNIHTVRTLNNNWIFVGSDVLNSSVNSFYIIKNY